MFAKRRSNIMEKKEKRTGNSIGDLNLSAVDVWKKYGTRVAERFVVNPFDNTGNDCRSNMVSGL
jgi:hypothetical protein